jgi:SH3 domain-containing YSC84-like protein 1
MLVMNERGADKLLSSKFTLGAEGSVAAGPVGRTATAQTDAQMHAEILSWSRSQGLFAGLALEGATLREDLDDNATLYGKRLENRQIVTTHVRTPKSAMKLIGLLNKFSPRERTAGPSGPTN